MRARERAAKYAAAARTSALLRPNADGIRPSTTIETAFGTGDLMAGYSDIRWSCTFFETSAKSLGSIE